MALGTSAVRRAATVVAAFGLMSGAVFVSAGPASAAEGDRNCETGDVCLYYSPDLKGALAAFYWNNGSHHNYNFPGGQGAGSGQRLADNAASVKNRARFVGVRIFEHINYGGVSIYVGPANSRNLDSLRNKNSSHRFE
jgi:hypothetical protein